MKKILAIFTMLAFCFIPSGLAEASATSKPEAPSITIISPNGGEDWSEGSIHKITWCSTGVKGQVLIEISSDGGDYYQAIDTPVPDIGEYEWYIAYDMSSNMKARVSSVADPSVSDETDGFFTLSPNTGTITLDSPNGGETLSIGSQVNIKWSSNVLDHFVKNQAKVFIEITYDGGSNYLIISKGTNNDGTYKWKVTGPVTTKAKIRVVSQLPGFSVWDVSDAYFTIQ
jgi:hypothetical protein